MRRFSLLLLGFSSVAVLTACGGGEAGPPVDQVVARRVVAAGPQNPDARMTGAIFTNLFVAGAPSTCTQVNGNIYDSKASVGLNGGPERPGAAGLEANTRYYVQVTDPSGSQVLGTSVRTTTPDPMDPMDTANKPILTDAYGNFACLQLSEIVWEVVGGVVTGNKGFVDTPNNGGEYKVWVSQDRTFPNALTKTDNFKVKSNVVVTATDTWTVELWKFYDANTNGVRDSGEPLLPWKVSFGGFPLQDTSASGPATFTPVPIGQFSARELRPDQPNWVSTNAYLGSAPATTTLSSLTSLYLNQIGVSITQASPPTQSVHFGNVCLGKGGGRTLGFWSNKNGQALITPSAQSVLEGLRALNLKDASGANFDPTSYSQLRTWLLNGSATNMAYMLSVQMAAMYLNWTVGYAQADPLLYAPGLATVNNAGFISVSGLVAEANEALGVNGYTRAGTSVRFYQELLKNALDAGNNDRDIFVQPTPCTGVTFNNALAALTPVVPAAPVLP